MDTKDELTTNAFTDEGRLLQAEYAIKNVSNAGTIIGLVCSDGVILFGLNSSKSSTKEKIYKLDSRTYCAISGLFGDANGLIQYARRSSIVMSQQICHEPNTKTLCEALGRRKQYFTHLTSARPFGVSLLYAGCDNNEYVLYSSDPSGTVNKWKTWSIGLNENEINQNLKNEYKENMSMLEGTRFLLQIFTKSRECSLSIADKIEILHYKKDEQYFLKEEEILDILKGLNLTN